MSPIAVELTGPGNRPRTGAEPEHFPFADRPRHRRSGFRSESPAIDNSLFENNRHHRRRSSAFLEVGLRDEDSLVADKIRRGSGSRPRLQVRFRSKVDVLEPEATDWTPAPTPTPEKQLLLESMPAYFPTLPRLLFLALLAALILPTINNSAFLQAGVSPIGAKAGPIGAPAPEGRQALPQPVRRQDSPTVLCKRWAQQSAVVNGTLYLYGGEATTSANQDSNTWNNDFVTLDLTKSWQISSPSLTGLPQPSGPPPVALGALWNSYDSLYLYGGEFSSNPATSPLPFSTWSYDISSKSWSESSDPDTVAGTNSDGGNQPVQRAAEGAGIAIPNLGRGFYFGGHLDGYTTEGWSQSIARVYLTSLLEYTFPGYSNPALNSGNPAGSGGIYRNITQGGTQDTDGFPERADGVLVYIPGYGKSGIIIGLAGGNNATFTQMNVIDVFDISTSTWYKQSTAGPTPDIRVNPCAVAVSAADGSSTQVHMYGGQNLVPYGSQIQYDDMWILTVPSFTWIKVDTSNQSTPPARAGHTCNIWNAQMVVVGGYVGQDLACESPGIYVFNTSSLTWQNDYQALSGGDPLNRQETQKKDPNALQGSYGYQVPAAVRSVIGGDAVGAATVTAPAQSAAQGPIATGKPITYTVTQSNGATVTETSTPSVVGGNGNGGSTGSSGDNSGPTGPNKGAIIAGVIAGLFALLAAYLGFCAWVYRKQLKLYKNHVTLAQRQQLSGDPRHIGAGGGAGYLAPRQPGGSSSRYTSEKEKSQHSSGDSTRNSGEATTSGSSQRRTALGSNNPYRNVPGGEGLATAASSTDDLMAGQEPSFLGVVLNPRRSLRVVNRD